jgi:hypothetical protein
LNAHKHA